MPSPTVSHDDIRAMLGDDVDEITLDRIIDTGATIDEVAEALGAFEADEAGEAFEGTAISARVVKVRAILDEAIQRDDDDDAASSRASPSRDAP